MEYQDDNKGIIFFRIVYFRAWFLKVKFSPQNCNAGVLEWRTSKP